MPRGVWPTCVARDFDLIAATVDGVNNNTALAVSGRRMLALHLTAKCFMCLSLARGMAVCLPRAVLCPLHSKAVGASACWLLMDSTAVGSTCIARRRCLGLHGPSLNAVASTVVPLFLSFKCIYHGNLCLLKLLLLYFIMHRQLSVVLSASKYCNR